MTLLQLSEVAKNYYLSLRGNIVQGWEKYVLTNGNDCLFVRADREPAPGEAIFFLQMRNRQLMCQLHKDNTAIAQHFLLRPLDALRWEITDQYEGIVITFREALYQATAHADIPTNLPSSTIEEAATSIREAGEWLQAEYPTLHTCNTAARRTLLQHINRPEQWLTLAAALNGLWYTGSEGIDIRTLLHAQLQDYLAEANPFSIDADEFLGLFHIPSDPDEAEYFLSPEECQEIISIVNTYWLSNRPSEQWAKDILWWPTLVK